MCVGSENGDEAVRDGRDAGEESEEEMQQDDQLQPLVSTSNICSDIPINPLSSYKLRGSASDLYEAFDIPYRAP